MDQFKFCRLALSTGLMLLVLTFPAHPDQLPMVPSPNGFIEASTLSAFIRNMAVAGQPASSKLIGAYYPPDALAEILSAGQTNPAAFCKANVLARLA